MRCAWWTVFAVMLAVAGCSQRDTDQGETTTQEGPGYGDSRVDIAMTLLEEGDVASGLEQLRQVGGLDVESEVPTWFDDALDCGTHSHRPTPAVIAAVTLAFAGAPVANPDGSSGINLVNDYGQGGPFTGGTLIADANGVLSGGVNGSEFQNYKAANFAANRHGYFHYTLLPHRYNTSSSSSGQAELPGDDDELSGANHR